MCASSIKIVDSEWTADLCSNSEALSFSASCLCRYIWKTLYMEARVGFGVLFYASISWVCICQPKPESITSV